MNTTKLAKHYPLLSPAERLSLMLAAAARGDDMEHARLTDSAPRVRYQLPDTFGRALAFLMVAALHRMQMLNLAALYFKASALAESAQENLSDRCRGVARVFGYLVACHAQGWVLFCERESLDPSVCEKVLEGGEVLEQAAMEAESHGFTADEVYDYARRTGDAIDNLKTVESVADELGEIYQMWVSKWE
jgi:hypothetical protein